MDPSRSRRSAGCQYRLRAADYDAWARFNNQPLSNTPAGQARFQQVVAMVNAQKLPAGGFSADFWSVELPQGFATRDQNAYDITMLDGYKLYRLKQRYNAGFGALAVPFENPWSLLLSLKLYF